MAKMNKKMRLLIIAAAVVLILGGLLALLLLLPDGENPADTSSVASEDTSVKLVDQEQADVEKIHIKNQHGEYDVVLKGDKEWEIPELKGFKQVSNTYSLLTSEAATVKADSVLFEKKQDLEKYGLDKPKTVVTITYKDGSTFQMNIGIETPGGGNYMTVEGKDPIYIYSGASYFEAKPYDYLDTTVFNIEATQGSTSSESDAAAQTLVVDRFELQRKDWKKPFVMVKSEEDMAEDAVLVSSYQITSPIRALSDDSKLETLITGFLNLSADSVEILKPTAAQIKERGLDKPQATVRVEFEGKTYTLKIGNAITCEATDDLDSLESGHQHTVVGYNVMRDGVDIIYQASDYSLPWLTFDPNKILSTFVVLPNISDVKKVTVGFDGKTYTFEPNKSVNEDEEEIFHPLYNGKTLNEDYFKSYYQVLLGLMQSGINEKKPVGKAMLTVRYDYLDADRKSDVLEVFDNGAGACVLSCNGDMSFETRLSYVTKIKDATALIIENKKIDPN